MPEPPPLAVVVSVYNGSVTSRLLDGVRQAYADKGGDPDTLLVLPAPGAFELAVLAAEAARSGLVRGVVALGCVIKGETEHDRYINHAVADSAARIGVETGVPVAFGLLTTNNAAQAEARAGGEHGNKGAEAMDALLETIGTIEALREAAATGKRDSLPGVRFTDARDKTEKKA